MDSLLASYASSDEEEQQHDDVDFSSKSNFGETCKLSQTSDIASLLPQSKSSSLLSLPQPKSASLLSLPQPKSSTLLSLPQPKSSSSLSLPQSKSLSSLPQPTPSTGCPSPRQPKSPSSFSSLSQPKSSVFASLPPPNSSSVVSFGALATSDNPQAPSNPPSYGSKPKKVVQFRPPIMLKPPNDEDDDDEEKERKPVKEPVSSNSGSSVSSFFSSLPAPKNTLGSGSAPALGAGRRSIVETIVPTNYGEKDMENNGGRNNRSQESYAGNLVNGSSTTLAAESSTTGTDLSNWISNNENYGSYGHYEGGGSYGGYDVDYNNYDGVSTMAAPAFSPETTGYFENVTKVPGKRGRNEIPMEIIEVKQDELMKNRPREDQVKSTGIAFGPAYQPVSTKGKPSKLHKRKHQIGSLYFDMKQKEQELAERRSKGFLTKAETQAKYGW